MERFSEEERKLLLNVLLDHEYAVELLSSEINDIEMISLLSSSTAYSWSKSTFSNSFLSSSEKRSILNQPPN